MYGGTSTGRPLEVDAVDPGGAGPHARGQGVRADAGGNPGGAWRLGPADVEAAAAFAAGLPSLAESLGSTVDEARREVRHWLHELRTGHSPWLHRRIVAAGRSLCASGYERIEYDEREVERIRAVLRRQPSVVLASHRSYLDGGALTVGFHDHALPPLTVFGGINMAFWPIGALWRRANGVFIRRGGAGLAYHYALRHTVGTLLERRQPLQWFPEGTRSRTGRLGAAKLGLLTYVVEAWRDGLVDDVQLVPVSIAYDQLREVAEYAQEAAGRAKRAESLGWLWRFVRGQRGRLGRIHVRFGTPLSLRAVLGPPEALPPRGSPAARNAVARLAQAAMDGIAAATPITTVALIARALLAAPHLELPLETLRAHVHADAGAARAAGMAMAGAVDAESLERVLDALAAEGVIERAAGALVRVPAAGEYAARWYANSIAAHPGGAASQRSTSA